MAKMTVVFTGNENNLFSRIISKVTKGPYTHVALIIDEKNLIESFASKIDSDPYVGVWLHPAGRYNKYKSAVFINVEIPDQKGAEQEIRDLLGCYYGFGDCIAAGIYSLTGRQIPANGELTMTCSETVIRILRAGGLNILPGVKPDVISPMDLYRALT